MSASGTVNPEDGNHTDLVAGVASTIDSAVTTGAVIHLPEQTQETPEPTEEEKRKAEEEAATRLIKKKPKLMIPSRRAKTG